jgi:hypothetical protein
MCEMYYVMYGKSNATVRPRTGSEGPEGDYGYSSTLSSISALDVGGWLTPRPGRLPPGKRPGTHFIGGSLAPRADPDGCGKSRFHCDLKPGPSSL